MYFPNVSRERNQDAASQERTRRRDAVADEVLLANGSDPRAATDRAERINLCKMYAEAPDRLSLFT